MDGHAGAAGTVFPMDARQRFAALLEERRDGVPLDEAALLIAACAEPDLDPEPVMAALDALATSCPGYTLDALVPHLFGPGRFGPNRDDYYDPRNSFLNHVLERHVGIPISLAVVALEVGRRIGVPLAGVGMPGHFLLQDKVDRGVFIDPFRGGQLLDREGCQRLYRDVVGDDAPWSDAYLDPVGNLSIISRILNNLRAIYEGRRDLVNLRWVMSLRAALPAPYGDDPAEFARSMAPLN
jgi:regulator of sirC expression with transglutaminase-like and TPR domain